MTYSVREPYNLIKLSKPDSKSIGGHVLRIALIANSDLAVYHWRAGLIKELVRQGMEVTVIVPMGNYVDKIKDLGTQCICIPMNRFLSPMSDILLLPRLFWVLRKGRFDLAHTMSIKPNVYGTIAAKLAGVKRVVCLLSGTGFAFADIPGLKQKLLRWFVILLYRLSLKISDKTWFQNPDDFEYFIKEGIIHRSKGVVIRGSGVDMKEYSQGSVSEEERSSLRKELGIPEYAHCVLMVVARMIWSKGIREFLESATIFMEKQPGWFFILVAPVDAGTPDAVHRDDIKGFENIDTIRIIDTFRHDIKVFEAISDIMVLPSFYPEGVPRVLIEGLAMSMPLVTTDRPGCRETVDHGKNGFLIPAQNKAALIDALNLLTQDESKRSEFGKYSRLKAENEFGEKMVLSRVMSELYGISGGSES